jgi:hypothetical protein
MFSLPMLNDDDSEERMDDRSITDRFQVCTSGSQKNLCIEFNALFSFPSFNLHQPLCNAGI